MTAPPVSVRHPLALAIGSVVVLAIVLLVNSNVFDGRLLGPDSFSRLNRLEYNLSSGDWSNQNYPHTNAPFGERIQWTQPLDVLLLVIAAPVALFTGWNSGLFFAGVVIGPLLHVAAAILIVLATRAIGDSDRALFAVGPLLVGQVALGTPFAVARPDHHGLILTLFMGHIAALFLSERKPHHQVRYLVIAGIAGAVSIWVSPEGLLTMGPAVLWLGGRWILSSTSERSSGLRVYGASAAVTLVVGWLVDPPPDGRFEVVYDRLSIVHVLLLVLLAAVAVGVTLPNFSAWHTRLVAVAAAGLVAAAVLLVVAPDVTKGPMASVPDDLWERFLDDSSEWRSIFDGGFTFAAACISLGVTALALVSYVLRFRRGNGLVVFLALNHVTFVVLALMQLRWMQYVAFLDVMVLAYWLGVALKRIDSIELGVASLAVRGLTVLAVLAIAPTLLVLDYDEPDEETNAEIASGSEDLPCTEPDATRALADEEPGIVLAPLFWGPEMVYVTDHDAISTPMHRNVDGIRFSYEVMAGSAADAEQRFVGRGVTHIVWCETSQWFPDVPDGGLYDDLQNERFPEWLDVVTAEGTGLRMARVVPG